MKSFNTVLNGIRNPNTRKIYASIYKGYADFLGTKKPAIDNAEKFVKTKSEAQDATVNLYTTALRTYFRENGIEVPRGKVKGRLKTVKVNNIREDKYVTRPEVDQLYKCANNLRDKTIIRLLYHGGLRASELLKLDVGDLDLKNEKVNVKGLKGSHKRRIVRLIRPELAVPTIRAFLSQRGINPGNPTAAQRKEPLFVSFRSENRLQYDGLLKLIVKLGPAINKDDLSPHWLRHGHVVWCKRAGIPPENTAQQIGDTIETTMKIYSHYCEDDRDRAFDIAMGRDAEKPENKSPIDEIEKMQIENNSMKDRIQSLEEMQQKLIESMATYDAFVENFPGTHDDWKRSLAKVKKAKA